MNGRVYDYNVGRFMSVDPFIQEPGNSQSINPYSYIMNNPLAGTDPTGYVGSRIKRKDPDPVQATVSQEGNTTKVKLTGGTAKQQKAVQKAINNGYKKKGFKMSDSSEKVGTLGARDTQVESSVSGDLKTANKVVTGAGVVAGGLEATKDVNLAMKSGAGTAFAATGNGSNAFTLTKNAKSKSILASLDVSKAGKNLARNTTVAGIAVSLGLNFMDARNGLISASEAIGKSSLDVSVMMVAMRAGIPGVIGATTYAVVDMTYEGGIIQMKRNALRNISNAFGINKSMKAIRRREDRPRPMRGLKEFFGIPDMGY